MNNLNQTINPYLPSWEYVPDGEPYVFGDRVYVYGSHDKFGGDVYCMLDYVCYSAPVNDLGSWRYEGVIYRKDQDPANADLQGNLYAPAVTVGPDGRYYLYYVLSSWGVVSVAVCDEPSGKYEFLGYVHYKDGTYLGQKEGDEPQFDPAVLTEGDRTYLYTGFCAVGDKSRHGAMGTVLGPDMLTIVEGPVFVAPGEPYSHDTSFDGHAFFEGPSIRKKDGKYFFIYSTQLYHELGYAVSDDPLSGFEYKGVLISNGDLNIDSYKPADKPMFYCANNHGSMVKIENDWYIFYHRHTNGTNFSRQECFEKLIEKKDGTFMQAKMTSCCGLEPLVSKGTYPTYIACNLFTDTDCTYIPWSGWMDDRFPKITQDGGDRDGGARIVEGDISGKDIEENRALDDHAEVQSDNLQIINTKDTRNEANYGYIANMRDSATAGFKYFDCKGVKKMSVCTKGYATGELELRLKWDDKAIGSFPIGYANVWHETKADIEIPDGVHDLFFTFKGTGYLQFAAFSFI